MIELKIKGKVFKAKNLVELDQLLNKELEKVNKKLDEINKSVQELKEYKKEIVKSLALDRTNKVKEKAEGEMFEPQLGDRKLEQ